MNSPDDMPGLKTPDLFFDQLYVYCDYVKPGKHTYLVHYHNILVEPRAAPRGKGSELQEYERRMPTHIKAQLLKGLKTAMTKACLVTDVNLTSYHQTLVRPQMEDYSVSIKSREGPIEKVREFDRRQTVFRDYARPTHKQVKEGLLFEIQFWKVPNIVRDVAEQEKIVEILLKHVEFLHEVFRIRSSMGGGYPVIRWLNFTRFVTEMNILD